MNMNSIPWMTKINDIGYLTGNTWQGWHEGTQLITDESVNQSFGGSKTIEDVNWWSYHSSVAAKFSGENLFNSTGCSSQMQNTKRTNITHFVGTFSDNSDFLNNHFTYPDYATSSCIRSAVGFALITDCVGSYSNKGGSAQAYLEKCGLFYADPTTRKRVLLIPNVKVDGNLNLNQLHPNNYPDTYWYSYRLSDSDISRVHDENLLLMNIGFQFVHDYKSAKHTSVCKLKQFRVLCGNSNGFVNPGQTGRLYMTPWHETKLSEVINNEPIAYGY